MNAPQRNNHSRCIGVSWDKSKRKWRARIAYNNKEHFLGYFTYFNYAVEVRKQAEIAFGILKDLEVKL